MTAQASASAPVARPLPRLRTDLAIEVVAEDARALPAVIVTDPVRSSYFRLAWPESSIFMAWMGASTLDELCQAVARDGGVQASEQNVLEVVSFALANQLTEADRGGGWSGLAQAHARRQHGWLKSLLHNYLFFRVPLVRPEAWLKSILPSLAFVFCRGFWLTVTAIGLAGAFLALRQWPAVLEAARQALQLQSIPLYGTAVLLLKAIHELGHALTTVRYGCRVPSMGVAIMLGTPVLYTDTSDSWRLARRSERLAIVGAGVAAEMIVACVAILLWPFLEDGFLREICFAFATASVVLSLTVNLNPLMRYDGYYALSDYLGVPNLQSRGFAMGVWRLRELLFDIGAPPPEELPQRLQRTLIGYALVVAVYRLFLYLGIAAIVYAFAGKAVGIVLGLVEVGVFIALPIWREMAAWWSLRSEIAGRARLLVSASVLTVGLAVLFVPWVAAVEVAAVLTAAGEEAIYVPFPARIAKIWIGDGSRVRTGDILFTADAADLERDLKRGLLEEHALAVRVARLHASDKERDQRIVTISQLRRAREKIASVQKRIDQLVIRAPFDGRIVDLDAELSPGVWIGSKTALAMLVSEGSSRARGLIAETDLARVAVGGAAVFVPDDAAQPRRRLRVEAILQASDGRISEPMLADRHGGTVLAGAARGELVARHGVFEIAFAPFDGDTRQIVRGVARIEAEGVSPAMLLWQSVARVLVREQGF